MLLFQHDSIVEPLLDILGLYNGVMLPFAAAVIMELHKTNNSDTLDGFHVKFLFRNSSEVTPYVLTIPGNIKPKLHINWLHLYIWDLLMAVCI